MHENKSTTDGEVSTKIIADLKLTFRESKYKAAHWTQFEAESVATWLSRCSLNYPMIPLSIVVSDGSDTTTREVSPEHVPRVP